MVDHEAGVTSSTGADQNCAWFVFDIVFIFHCNDARPSLLDNMVARNREDVKGDKEREYYLGHSVKALAGRWQKGALSLSLSLSALSWPRTQFVSKPYIPNKL